MKLDARTVRLVAVGAAIGANCQSCLQVNIARALENGAGEQEIADAIETGKMVRNCAASKMDELAAELAGSVSSSVPGAVGGCGCASPSKGT